MSPGALWTSPLGLGSRAALGKFDHHWMSNIDAMKYQSRFFGKPKEFKWISLQKPSRAYSMSVGY
jgi:hypothetical protein